MDARARGGLRLPAPVTVAQRVYLAVAHRRGPTNKES